MPAPIPAAQPVTVPATQAATYDRWGLPLVVFATDTTTGRIRADLTAHRSGEAVDAWSPDPLHRVNFVSADLVAEVVGLGSAEAIAELQAVQAGILSLTRRLMAARGLL